jgi:hypothetical protein
VIRVETSEQDGQILQLSARAARPFARCGRIAESRSISTKPVQRSRHSARRSRNGGRARWLGRARARRRATNPSHGSLSPSAAKLQILRWVAENASRAILCSPGLGTGRSSWTIWYGGIAGLARRSRASLMVQGAGRTTRQAPRYPSPPRGLGGLEETGSLRSTPESLMLQPADGKPDRPMGLEAYEDASKARAAFSAR